LAVEAAAKACVPAAEREKVRLTVLAAEEAAAERTDALGAATAAEESKKTPEALEALVNLLRATRSAPTEFHAHLYGGADTMPEGALKFNVGERNIEQGFNLVDRYGFQIQGVDVGEDIPRTVVLTLATGEVTMRRGDGAAPQPHLQASLARSKT
jgi:chemotaxis protein CheD